MAEATKERPPGGLHHNHSDPKFTLRVYTRLMSRRDGERERLKALVQGADWAGTGRETRIEDSDPSLHPMPESRNPQSDAGCVRVGVTGLEPVTSSLSSWRSPN